MNLNSTEKYLIKKYPKLFKEGMSVPEYNKSSVLSYKLENVSYNKLNKQSLFSDWNIMLGFNVLLSGTLILFPNFGLSKTVEQYSKLGLYSDFSSNNFVNLFNIITHLNFSDYKVLVDNLSVFFLAFIMFLGFGIGYASYQSIKYIIDSIKFNKDIENSNSLREALNYVTDIFNSEDSEKLYDIKTNYPNLYSICYFRNQLQTDYTLSDIEESVIKLSKEAKKREKTFDLLDHYKDKLSSVFNDIPNYSKTIKGKIISIIEDMPSFVTKHTALDQIKVDKMNFKHMNLSQLTIIAKVNYSPELYPILEKHDVTLAILLETLELMKDNLDNIDDFNKQEINTELKVSIDSLFEDLKPIIKLMFLDLINQNILFKETVVGEEELNQLNSLLSTNNRASY